MKISGLDEFQRSLGNLSAKAQALSGDHNVPLKELLSDSFVRSHSQFNSLEDLFEASGFSVNSQEDFEKIPDAEWDTFIRGNSDFPDWKSMLGSAGTEWMKTQLGFN
jgi:hypothetical protein